MTAKRRVSNDIDSQKNNPSAVGSKSKVGQWIKTIYTFNAEILACNFSTSFTWIGTSHDLEYSRSNTGI